MGTSTLEITIATELIPVAVNALTVTGLYLPTRVADTLPASGQPRRTVERSPVLPQLEDFSEDVLQNMLAGIVIQGPDGRFEYVNAAAAKMLGYSAEELTGEYWTMIVAEDQREIVEQADRHRSKGKADQYRLELQRVDGSRLPVLVSASSRMEGSGFGGSVAVFTDISDLSRAEERIRLQAAALDSAANAIMITNRRGDIEWVNPAWTKMTGYSREEVMGKNPRLLKSGVQDEEFYQDLWTTIMSGRVWRGEVINKRKDGSLYTEEETITPLMDEADKIKHFIAVKRDISERKHNEARIAKQLSQLNALRQIDLAITASLDPRVTFNVLLTQVTEQLQIDAADILVFDRHSQTLEFSAGRGFRTDALQFTLLRLGEGFAGRAAQERKIVSVTDLSDSENSLSRSASFKDEGFVSYFAVPLVSKGAVQGVLEILHRERLEPSQSWLDFLEALAGQAAIAIDNSMLYDELNQSNSELRRAYDSTLEGWGRALELRDIETEGHSQRVTETSVRLARKMGVSGAELLHVRRGALLHDIGKMGIPDSILHKPGALSDAEWEIMHKHPRYAFEMLASTDYLRPSLDIPYCHHEKWDGSGYPRGLKEQEIPLSARIFAIVDVWDALRSARPYSEPWTDEMALDYLKEQRGSHFDPQVVDAFLELLEGI